MTDQFVGEIRLFAGNFAPNGWAFCNGQIMAISQNTALFSLLGTNYGGDGRSTFALPNLEDMTPIAAGQGPGLSPRIVGESGGQAAVTLAPSEAPVHTHPGSSNRGTTDQPTGAIPAAHGRYVAGAVAAWPGQPHNNRPPYLGVSFIIALVGIFPPRS
jgi:microcystin-dependent protein